MFENRIEGLRKKYPQLEAQLSDPAVISDQKKFVTLSKEYSHIKYVLSLVDRLHRLSQVIEDGQALAKDESCDEELKAMAVAEAQEAVAQKEILDKELVLCFLPRDEKDNKNTIVEIRAGTGGDEACLFCEELFRMYQRYCEGRAWTCEVLDSSPTELGGLKEVIFTIDGEDVYRRMRYESGTHRVQRVPRTEGSGRIHTSAVTVAVLPEAEEVDIAIDPKDLRIDVYRSGGPGGQSVNTMDSAVRITYLPTGMIVQCQDGKSQRQNKLQAMKVLRARLLQIEEEKVQKARSDARKSQIGSGDRSEKIRTYNFPQGRVTDHRIPLTLYRLDDVLDGGIDPFIDALIEKEYAEEIAAINQGHE